MHKTCIEGKDYKDVLVEKILESKEAIKSARETAEVKPQALDQSNNKSERA